MAPDAVRNVNPTAFMADLRPSDNLIRAPRRPRNLLPNFAVPGYFNN
jgi:hypothetical protein